MPVIRTNVTNIMKLAIYSGRNVDAKNPTIPMINPITAPQIGKKYIFLAMTRKSKPYFEVGIIVKKERVEINGSKTIQKVPPSDIA